MEVSETVGAAGGAVCWSRRLFAAASVASFSFAVMKLFSLVGAVPSFGGAALSFGGTSFSFGGAALSFVLSLSLVVASVDESSFDDLAFSYTVPPITILTGLSELLGFSPDFSVIVLTEASLVFWKSAFPITGEESWAGVTADASVGLGFLMAGIVAFASAASCAATLAKRRPYRAR